MKLERYKTLKSEIHSDDRISDVLLDEDFITPDKSAAFTPYDCVVCYNVEESLDNEDLSDIINNYSSHNKQNVKNNVKSMIQDVEYDRIVGAEKNETSEPGDFLVYISLESLEEYKSRF